MSRSDGVRPAFPGADSDHRLDRDRPDLAVADPVGLRRLDHHADQVVGVLVLAEDLDADLRHQVDLVLGPAVHLRVPALPAVSACFGDRQAVDAERLQRGLDVVQLERLDDSGDELHLVSLRQPVPRFRCRRFIRPADVCQPRETPGLVVTGMFPWRPFQPRIASTKASGSNGARSSGPSPRPTSLTGTPSSRWTEMTMPPLAVPSSLVRMIPVISTTSANTRACRRPFWPVVASSTSSTSSTVPCRSITRLILPSSSISPALVCSRPAVSTITLSTPRMMPAFTASNATLAGSAPSRSERTTWAPTRSPQVCS